jgi:SSS family transporter
MDQSPLHLSDWIVIALYMGLTLGIAVWSKFSQKETSEDYFLAGRSIPWFLASLAIFASLFSTISFVSVPGEAFGHGMMLSLNSWLGFIFYPLAIWLFLRFFFFLPTFTAYEYLERRFNLATRVLASSIFTLVKLIYAGVVFYAAAVLIEALVGINPVLTIIVVGLVTVGYTTLSGMKGVILTDAMQACVIVAGMGAILYILLSSAGFDVAAIYRFSAEHGRGFEGIAKPEFWRFDLHDRYSFWLLMLHLITSPLVALSCDQLVVQRLLTVNGYKGAIRATYSSILIGLPVGAIFWLVGISLFYYYGQQPGKLPENIAPDKVLGFFIRTATPAPVPGLIAAAALAALMSTISSVVNSVATVIYRDGLVRLGVCKEGATHEITTCRALSAVAGLMSVGMALLLQYGGSGIKSSIFEVAGIWAGLWVVLMTAFLLGVLVPRVSGKAMMCGLATGGAVTLALPYLLYYSVPEQERISFNWMGTPGMLISFALALGLSLLWPNRKDLTDLTLWTLKRKDTRTPETAKSNAA